MSKFVAEFVDWLRWHTTFGERKRKLAADWISNWEQADE